VGIILACKDKKKKMELAQKWITDTGKKKISRSKRHNFC
jgi:hypothetical protein